MDDRYADLAALYRLCELTLSTHPPGEAYQVLLEAIGDVLECPVVAIERLDRRRPDQLLMVAACGMSLPAEGLLATPLDQTVSGGALRTGSPVIETRLGSRSAHAHPTLVSAGMKTVAAFPLGSQRKLAGTLLVAHPESLPSTERLERLGIRIATIVASYMERLSAEDELRETARRYQTLAGQLQQMNRELESFAYSVSHDLRAPVRTMQGFAHALLQKFDEEKDAQARDFASRIISAGHASEQLISNLLTYSRVNLAEVGVEPVRLESVVERATAQLQADLDASGARMEIQLPLGTVLGNDTIVVQAVSNLFSNALKFVPDDRTPHIRVRCEHGDTTARLWVEDNGIGVPRGHEEQIFGVFERVSNGSDKPGTGIGLAIVRRGMQRIGGTCGVVPRECSGSAFWIELRKDRRDR